MKGLVLFFFDEFDVLATDIGEQVAGALWAEFFVTCFDGDEESVIGRAVELLTGKQRVVEARQLHQAEQAEQHGETGEQNCQLEHHREERRDGEDVGWLRLNDSWIDDHLGHVSEREGGCATGDTTEEHEPWKNGTFQAHRAIKAVDRIRGVAIPFAEARIADFFRSLVERRGAFELGEIAINSFSGSAHVKKVISLKLSVVRNSALGFGEFVLVGRNFFRTFIRMIFVVLEVWIALQLGPFDFGDVDAWQEAEEQQEKC